MNADKVAAPPEEQKKPSIWAKSWKATKDFVKGTLTTLPITAISSGAALGLSLIVTNISGGTIDPLGVGGHFFGRWIGSSVIGSVVIGGVKTFQNWDKPECCDKKEEKATARDKRQHAMAMGRSRGHELPGSAPFTPPVDREQRQQRTQGQVGA